MTIRITKIICTDEQKKEMRVKEVRKMRLGFCLRGRKDKCGNLGLRLPVLIMRELLQCKDIRTFSRCSIECQQYKSATQQQQNSSNQDRLIKIQNLSLTEYLVFP